MARKRNRHPAPSPEHTMSEYPVNASGYNAGHDAATAANAIYYRDVVPDAVDPAEEIDEATKQEIAPIDPDHEEWAEWADGFDSGWWAGVASKR